MSVRGSKRGKSSHEQKRAKKPSGLLFMGGKRGAAGGLLFTKAKPTPSFEHSVRGGRR